MDFFSSFYNLEIFNRLQEEQKIEIRHIIYRVTPFFDIINRKFPEFTPHGFMHIMSVLDNLERLLIGISVDCSKNLAEKLDSEQLYCLFLAAILHDIGLTPE